MFRGRTRPWRTECERRQKDKGHTQHTTSSQSIKYINNLFRFVCWFETMSWNLIQTAHLHRVEFSKMSDKVHLINSQCSHSTIKEHHALLAKLNRSEFYGWYMENITKSDHVIEKVFSNSFNSFTRFHMQNFTLKTKIKHAHLNQKDWKREF